MTEPSELRVDLGADGLLGIPYVDVVGEAGDGPHLTVIAGAPGEATAFSRPAEHEGWIWMTTDHAGWWQPAVKPGTPVAEGDLLGTVSPLIGGPPARITAPAAGVPIFITSSPAVSADGLLLGLALDSPGTK